MSQELDPLPERPDPAPLAPATRPSARPPLRVLDRAPRNLRRAARIVVAGSLLPWMPGEPQSLAGSAWLLTLLAKAAMGAAACLWLQQVRHDFGPRLGGVLGRLADLPLGRRPELVEERQRRGDERTPAARVHPFPTALHGLAFLLVVVAIVLAWNDPRQGLLGSSGVPEVLMLGWAAFAWVHLASYERWGGFNPLFPLVFVGMLCAGAAAVVGALGGGATGPTKLLSLLGGAAVAAGGGLASYTIAAAMRAAKREGDRKRAAALAARKAARGKAEND